MPREITAHKDSYLNLSSEVLSVYPTTIFYPWHDVISADGKYPALNGVYSLVGLENKTGGYVLAVEEDTRNSLESNGVNTRFTDLSGWNIITNTSNDFATTLVADSPTNQAFYMVRLQSDQDITDAVILKTDTYAFMPPLSEYTLSFYYRTATNTETGKLKVTVEDTVDGKYLDNEEFNLTDSWTRGEVSFTTGGGATTQFIQFSINFDGYIDITGIQLESGNHASAWYDQSGNRGDGYLKLSDFETYPAFFPEDQIAISTWVKFTHYHIGLAQTIIGCATSGYKLWKSPAGVIEFAVHLFDGSFARASFDLDLLPENEWHMVTGIFSGRKISIYLDYILRDSSTTTSELIYYLDDSVNNIESKQLYVGKDPNLISSNQITTIFLFEPRDLNDKVKVVTFNPGSGLFYDNPSTQHIIDFNFQVGAPTNNFDIPIGEPSDSNNQVWVFSNGVLQKESSDYTIVNATGPPAPFTVSFNSARGQGDVVQIYIIQDSVGANVVRYDWTSTPSQTVFTLPVYTADGSHLLVFCNGICMTRGASSDYIETNTTTFTFNSPREAEDTISAFKFAGSDQFEVQDFTATQGQAAFQLNPVHLQSDSLIVFSNGILNINTYDYTSSTQDLLNAYLKNTRIEPGRVNILQSFVRFIQAREAGDYLDILHIDPDGSVLGAFEFIFQANKLMKDFTIDMSPPVNLDDHLLVFANGILQQRGPTNDYTVSSAGEQTTVHFVSDVHINDIIKIVVINEDTLTFHRNDYISAGSQSTFNIGAYTNDHEHLMVFTNGVMQIEGNRYTGDASRDYYEASGSTITFNTPRENGDFVTVFKLDGPARIEHDIYDIVSTQFKFNFTNEYAYYVYNMINSSGILQSLNIDYSTTEAGVITAINVNSQVVQSWYETDIIYDWRYKKVII